MAQYPTDISPTPVFGGGGDDTSFLQKLRMNNIFPPGGGGSTPFGMPNLDVAKSDPQGILNRILPIILGERERDRQLQRDLAQKQRIASGDIDPLTGKPRRQQQEMPFGQPNVVYKPSSATEISPYQQEQLSLSRERLAQQGTLGRERIATTRRGQDISQQRADVYKFKSENPNMRIVTPKGGNITAINPMTGESMDLGISTGTMTEEELQDLRGGQAMERVEAVTERGKEARQETAQSRLAEIAARASGQKELAGYRQDIKPELPTQTKAREQNAARELVTTQPDLAQYITIQPNGQFSIDPNTPLPVLSQIQQAIYAKSPQVTTDINLPPSGKTSTPKAKTPTASKPTAADLLKKYGG